MDLRITEMEYLNESGIQMVICYLNGGLNTGLVSKWWSEYQTNIKMVVWIVNRSRIRQIPLT